MSEEPAEGTIELDDVELREVPRRKTNRTKGTENGLMEVMHDEESPQ